MATGKSSPLTEEGVLSDILALAGPDGAQRLLAQIGTDLAEVRRGMISALPASDRTALRSATHVLISLAGTIGAPRLQKGAVALNTAAHGDDWAKVLDLAGPVLTDLAALIDDVARRLGGGRA